MTSYYFALPLIGPVSSQIISGICLYLTMIIGMLAKAIWDRTEEGKIWPDAPSLVRPLIVSPLVFSGFGGLVYLKELQLNMSVSTLLYAFQIGFMWQHVLRKRPSQQSIVR